MKKEDLEKILGKLLEKYLIYAPLKKDDDIIVDLLTTLDQLDWSGQIPKNTFKKYLLPIKQDLYLFKNNKVIDVKDSSKKQIIWGINILDLQAIGLYEQVFEKDAHYQKNRQNTFIVGYSAGLDADYRNYTVFHEKFEADVLEHLMFDIFIEQQKDKTFKFYSGSEKGQILLDNHLIKDYEHIEFAGFVPQEGMKKEVQDLYDKVKNSFDNNVWEELNEKCIACGRCSMVCPTCFCYDQYDEPTKAGVLKSRQWSSCFFNNFSTMAGEHEPLDSIKKKIYFWYYHKFVRIPEEFKYPGCVGCMRCFKECPVDINIKEVLGKL